MGQGASSEQEAIAKLLLQFLQKRGIKYDETKLRILLKWLRNAEGTLRKYTNLLQGWQSRNFVLDFEMGILQYFVNEQSNNQKPQGTLSLAGAIISSSDEVPHMLVAYSANGEMHKLRAADAKEKQYWINQLRSCAKHHKECNSKSVSSLRSRSSSLLPPGTVNSASPSGQKHMNQSVVTIAHHKSPAAARRVKSQLSDQLHEVREIMSQAEVHQKNLVQATEALPSSGPLSALERIICFVEYYLTAFHESRNGAVAKKPYNPKIGETFHCSWGVPKDKVKAFRTNGASAVSKDPKSKNYQTGLPCYH